MLSEREQQQALRGRQRSVTNESFGGEWRILRPGESVEVVTPFHRLALPPVSAPSRTSRSSPDQEKMLTS